MEGGGAISVGDEGKKAKSPSSALVSVKSQGAGPQSKHSREIIRSRFMEAERPKDENLHQTSHQSSKVFL